MLFRSYTRFVDFLSFYFNSIKVRLEHTSAPSFALVLLHFNSIKVRLEHSFPSVLLIQTKFQFHKGTIRTFLGCGPPVRDAYFNSIKVRLELDFKSLDIVNE